MRHGQAHDLKGRYLSVPVTISVTDALEDVKDRFNDVLPIDVLNKLGAERKETKDTKYLLWSLSEENEELRASLEEDADEMNPQMYALTRENAEFRELTAKLSSELNAWQERNGPLANKEDMRKLAQW